MRQSESKISNLKEFCQFLLEEKLDEVAFQNLVLAKEKQVPLLSLFAHLPEKELLEFVKKGLTQFLEDVLNDHYLDSLEESILQWKEDRIPEIPRDQVQVSDLVLTYRVRNNALLKYLPDFTRDINIALKIVRDLDHVVEQYEEKAFEAYDQIRTLEMKKAYDDIVTNEAKLREAQVIANIGSWEYDIPRDEVTWSDQLYNIFGISNNEKIDFKRYSESLHPADRDMVLATISKSVEEKKPYSLEHRLVQPDGTVKWVSSRGKVSEQDNGKPVKLTGTALDITKDKIIREKLEQRQKATENLNKELEAFSYTISHDLRSPLRAIDGFGQVLEEDFGSVLDDEGKRVLNIIRENTRLMGNLIDDLLAFSRINRKAFNKQPVKMKEMVEKVVENIRIAESADCRIEISDLPDAKADSGLIRQVWYNLIANAVKFSSGKEDAEVKISADRKAKEYVYIVADNGVGFDMDFKDKLFGVFQRLHSNNEFSGTGVGLATVQRIILRHGGRVWAEGKVGQGATFYFTLPIEKK